MKASLFISVVVSFLALPTNLDAHPGAVGHTHEKPANLRIWKDADGFFELEASFVAAKADQVLLARMDGSQTWIPRDRLSRADQEWVARRMIEIQTLNESPPIISATPSRRSDADSSARGSLGGLGVVAVLIVLGGAGLVFGRRRFALPIVLVMFASLALVLGCYTRAEEETEFVAWQDRTPPEIVAHFQAFMDKLKFRWNNETLFIDSNGLPDHPMMVGITNWQQQVPLPHPYSGNNAWQIPLKPRMADKPISAKNALYRGAIALAVNGVPIFNALNNRGEDAFLIGELDEFGGHCGKGDDYHYHAAPLHLQKIVGEGKPIGYALDGFPLYGLTDKKLDEFNGRFDEAGNYRYHSTKTYPYINGGLKGVVEVRSDGVEPQPRTSPVRPPTSPLRGAKITGFKVDEDKKTYALKYEVKGQTWMINYTINANGSVTFVYVDEKGKEQTETYTRREGGGKDKKGDEKKKKGKSPEKG